MTDKFEINISPLRQYTKYKGSSYTLAVIQFDVVKDGIRFDNGYDGRYECCDVGLRKLVDAADDFLSGKIVSEERLSFEIPYINGGSVQYGYFFDIFPDDYWVFNITDNLSLPKVEIEYSCKIGREQVKAVRDSLIKQIAAFDWENCGKTEFFRFSFPEREYTWCYSAKELEHTLRDHLVGDTLKKIYVSGTNFADPLHVEENFVGYYIGPQVYFEFEKIHADILAHAEGLFEIRLFVPSEVSKERFFDTIEDADKILCDTAYPFITSYTDAGVMAVDVIPTECWPWTPVDFDKSKIEKPVELPSIIEFTLSNNTILSIAGLDDDFYIKMEQK